MSEAAYWAKYNAPVFEEARKNNGKSRRGEVIILHTIGAKTGREHVIPLNFVQDGDRYIVVASKGGSLRNPAWYHNLVAHPDIEVEIALGIAGDRGDVMEAGNLWSHRNVFLGGRGGL